MAEEMFVDAMDDLKKLADQMEQEFFELVTSRMKIPSATRQKWKPLMDIYELQAEIIIKLEIPGVKKEAISVIQDGNRIQISGTRKLEERPDINTYHQMEINYGEFERTVVLPDTFPVGDVKAEYKDGFIHIRCSKRSFTKVLAITEG